MGDRVARYCKTHKLADYVDVKNAHCISPGCTTRANYGVVDTKKLLYCNRHKLEGHVQLGAKRCGTPGCRTQPLFGIVGTKKPLYCADHKDPDHIDVKTKRCAAVDCKKQCKFGVAGTTTPIYCVTHKQPEHIDVRNRHCAAIGCSKQPHFGPAGSKSGIFCVTHKPLEYIDVTNFHCIEPECTTQPSYGPIGGSTFLYCAIHKKLGDIDLRHTTCNFAGCKVRPIFGNPDIGVAIHCIKHKYPSDIDVCNIECMLPECNTRANYGYPGNAVERCKVHVQVGMIVHPRRRCAEKNCKDIGIWGHNSESTDRRCETHRIPNDINIIEGYCASCGLEFVLSPAGTCLNCGEISKIKRQYLIKQKCVKMALEAAHIKIDSYDKQLDGGECSRKRPDFVIDGTYRKIVVEVDEHQHNRGRDYGLLCEYRRMWDIAQALGMPTIFIRYNPDSYLDINGVRRDPPASIREAALISWITTLIARDPPPGVFASTLYLYYDLFDKSEYATEEPLEDPMNQFTPPMTISDDDFEYLLATFGNL